MRTIKNDTNKKYADLKENDYFIGKRSMSEICRSPVLSLTRGVVGLGVVRHGKVAWSNVVHDDIR